MKLKLFISFFFLKLMFSFSGIAQEGIIRGHVYEEKSGEPIIYANVVLEGTNYGTNTDENGLFTFIGVPVGSYEMRVSFIGYEEMVKTVEFKQNKINYYQVNLNEGGVNLGVIDISAERTQAKTEVRISKLRVSKKQIKALPSTGGDADIIQYLQVLPGVISTGDQGGQIFIRGGAPVQNKILLDGLTIYNPFHSIGFYSIFETELIRNVDVLTGGFNAEHGGRISAIVDINTREGNKKRFGGQLSASPFMVKGLFEGPLIKMKENGSGLSLVLTTKRSIIDQTSKTLYSYAAANDSIGLPFKFSDTYGKLSFLTPNGSKFSVFGFKFDDTFDDPSVSRIDWSNEGGGLTFDLLPNASQITLNGIIGYSKYDIGIIESSGDPRSSLIREYLLGIDFNYYGSDVAVNYGLDLRSIRTEFDFTNPFGIRLSQFQNTTEMSGFLKFRKSWDKFVFEPGVRGQFYASLGEFSLEPRLGLKWNITETTRVKGAAGLYTQNVISTSNERDVVNLFTGFLSGPEEQFNNLEGERVSSKLQKSRHLVLGVEQDFGSKFKLNVEGYLKDFPQLIVVNRNKTSVQESDYATEEGQAYGVDFSVKYETPSLYVWATYTLGFVNRNDGEQEFPTIYDRRHNINFLTTYSFGSEKDYQLSFRWNFGSGFPFTKTQAFYNQQLLNSGPDPDFLTSNPDNIGIIYSETRNGGRLPYYHRLDFSIQKKFEFTEYANLEAVLSVTNVYNRDNIFYFDRVRFERVDQLPIIPSLGIRLNF